MAQSPPLPVNWVPPHPRDQLKSLVGGGLPHSQEVSALLGRRRPLASMLGGGPGSPDPKLGQTELFPSHMGRPVPLPGRGLGTHGEPGSPHVPRMGASPGEPWRPPAPQGHVTPAWAQERRAPPPFQPPRARTGGALIHVPGASPTAGSLRWVGPCPSLMGPPWLLEPQNQSRPHLPLLPRLPHPTQRAWWAGSGKEQGHGFHDDDLSQDDHTLWDDDMFWDRCSVCVSRIDTIKASESNPGWRRPVQARMTATRRRRLQQRPCPASGAAGEVFPTQRGPALGHPGRQACHPATWSGRRTRPC